MTSPSNKLRGYRVLLLDRNMVLMFFSADKDKKDVRGNEAERTSSLEELDEGERMIERKRRTRLVNLSLLSSCSPVKTSAGY